MRLSDLGPNFAILKQPMNWLLVAFVTALLIFISYQISKATSKD